MSDQVIDRATQLKELCQKNGILYIELKRPDEFDIIYNLFFNHVPVLKPTDEELKQHTSLFYSYVGLYEHYISPAKSIDATIEWSHIAATIQDKYTNVPLFNLGYYYDKQGFKDLAMTYHKKSAKQGGLWSFQKLIERDAKKKTKWMWLFAVNYRNEKHSEILYAGSIQKNRLLFCDHTPKIIPYTLYETFLKTEYAAFQDALQLFIDIPEIYERYAARELLDKLFNTELWKYFTFQKETLERPTKLLEEFKKNIQDITDILSPQLEQDVKLLYDFYQSRHELFNKKYPILNHYSYEIDYWYFMYCKEKIVKYTERLLEEAKYVPETGAYYLAAKEAFEERSSSSSQ
jgi:hypothetical protein